MPWTKGSAHLTPIAKLAMLQSALEATFRDNLIIRDKGTGVLLYSNRQQSATWTWVGGAEKPFSARVGAAALPDDLESSFAGGLDLGEESTVPVLAESVEAECLWSVAQGAPSEGAGTCADGPLDRLRAVNLCFPFLQSSLPSVDSAETVISSSSRKADASVSSGPHHVTATVVSDPFQRQVLIAKIFNVVPSMLFIAREMDDKGTPHVIFLNDCMVDATGFNNEDVVVAPELLLGDLPPAGIVKLVYPADIPVVLSFVRSFFQQARQHAGDELRHQRDKQAADSATRAAMITQLAVEATAARTASQLQTMGSARSSGLSFDFNPKDMSGIVLGMPSSVSSDLLFDPHCTPKASAIVFPGSDVIPRCPSVPAPPVDSPPTTSPMAGGLENHDPSLRLVRKEPVVRPAIEFRLMLQNGKHIWVRGEAAAITCPFDGVTKLALTMVNIEERRDLRHQLEDEKNVVASVVAQLPVAVAVAQLDGKQQWNSEYARVLGLPARRGRSSSTGSVGSRSATPDVLGDKPRLFSAGSSDCVLYRMPSDADILRSVKSSFSSLSSMSRSRASTALSPAPAPDGEEAIGPQPATTRGHASASAGLADDYQALLRQGLLRPYEARNYPLARTIVNGSTVEAERAVVHNTVTGEFTPVMISSSAVRSARGELVAGVATIQDISNILKAEKAKGELVVAEQAAAATRDLLSVASHESRTPLAAILAMTGFLEDGPLTVEQKECVDAIKESGRLLLTLITDLLDFNRIEAGKLQLERRLFSPYELLRHVTKMMTSYGKARNVKVELAAPGEEGDLFRRSMVVSDSQRLSQIIFNLVSNACKFSNVGGTVTIEASAKVTASAAFDDPSGPLSSLTPTVTSDGVSPENSDGHGLGEERCRVKLDIRVVDKGKGMSPSELNKIRMFLPFTQAESGTARKAGGFGLGLNISNKLLTLMGGQLEVDSVEGQGSTFGFSVVLSGKINEAAPLTRAAPTSSMPLRPLRARGPKLAPLEILSAYRSSQQAPVSPLGTLTHTSFLAQPAQEFKAESLTLHAPISPLAVGSLQDSPGFSPRAAPCSPSGPIKLTALRSAQSGCDLFTWQQMMPLAPAPADSFARGDAPLKPAAISIRPRILVAEDNKMNQKIMVRYLAKLGYVSGTEVTVVEDGKAAVDELKRAFLSGSERPYDLVLMDCLMPKYDGYYGTAAIRALPYGGCKDVPVVAVTASTLQQDIERTAASGFDGHLSKPFSVDQLKATVDRWLPATLSSAFDHGLACFGPEHGNSTNLPAAASSRMQSRTSAGCITPKLELAPLPSARMVMRHDADASSGPSKVEERTSSLLAVYSTPPISPKHGVPAFAVPTASSTLASPEQREVLRGVGLHLALPGTETTTSIPNGDTSVGLVTRLKRFFRNGPTK